ncbi:MAG: histidine kinase [Oscillospiraceae bacterium]|nr:histidine kinase [Oscillospiraceae bacterium]
MNIWAVFFYSFTCGAALTLTILELWVAVGSPGMDRWSRRFFTMFFASILLGYGAFLVEILTYLLPGSATAAQIASYCESLLVFPYPMLTVYLLHICGENWRKSTLFRVELAICGLYFTLLNVAQFTPFFYNVTPDAQLVLAPEYPLLILPVLAILLLNAVGVIRRRDRLPKRLLRALLVCLLPIALILFVHLFVPVFLLIHAGLLLTAFSMVGVILSSQLKQYLFAQRKITEQHQEIARQRTSVMVLQMRPHFIYNTMVSIYSLCNQDPHKARKVIADFTNYLRKNFSAIASDHTIPFTAEWEHTRAYLAVEQAVYEDTLSVDYDMPHLHFRVPPLTLQPIVENAVKHGRNPQAGPLHIFIRTRCAESGSVITVEDNGPGFADAPNDSEPHIALANIRQRLELMCGGSLQIAPREGGGTVVTVTIPRQEPEPPRFGA